MAQQAIGLIAGAAGAVAGFYAGFALLFPAAFALLSGWLLTKAVQPPDKPMLPAGAVQIGHGLWMLLGLILLSQYDSMLIDVAILVAGGAWLALRPSAVAVGILGAYQVFGIVVNGRLFAEAEWGTVEHKGLTVHLLLRVAALALMAGGLYGIRKVAKEAIAKTPAVAVSPRTDSPDWAG